MREDKTVLEQCPYGQDENNCKTSSLWDRTKQFQNIVLMGQKCIRFWFIELNLWLSCVATDVNPVLFVLYLHMKYTVEMVPLHTYIV